MTLTDAMSSSTKENRRNGRSHRHGFQRDRGTPSSQSEYVNSTLGAKCKRPRPANRRCPSTVMKSVDLNQEIVDSRSRSPQGTAYAGAKFSESPSPDLLPKPPSHWVASEKVDKPYMVASTIGGSSYQKEPLTYGKLLFMHRFDPTQTGIFPQLSLQILMKMQLTRSRKIGYTRF